MRLMQDMHGHLRRPTRLIVTAAMALSTLVLTSSRPGAAAQQRVFVDRFEQPGAWQTFEEIVNGSSCYGDGIGSVARSGGAAFSGSYGLDVAANAAESVKSNHLIAHQPVFPDPAAGRVTYSVWARQEPVAPGRAGEAGPEISVQSTALQPGGGSLTTIAGIQYLTNPYSGRSGTWQIWRDRNGQATWEPFLTQPIERGKWYRLLLEADWTTGRYKRFTVSGSGWQKSVDVSHIPLGVSNKGFTTAATELTLESENLYNNCGTAGPTRFSVHYDDVVLVMTA